VNLNFYPFSTTIYYKFLKSNFLYYLDTKNSKKVTNYFAIYSNEQKIYELQSLTLNLIKRFKELRKKIKL